MPATCTIRHLLAQRARECGEKCFVEFEDGSAWSYAEAMTRAEAVAGGLAARGVSKGDPVIVWLPNGPEMVAAWLGIGWLGAGFVPLNLSWRGPMLDNALDLIGADLAIVHADLLGELDESHFETVIASGAQFAELLASPPAEALEPVNDWDTAQLMFTSGTTGNSKAVIGTYIQNAMFLAPPDPEALGRDARFLLVLPQFHAGGIASLYSLLLSGGTAIVVRQFSTGDFWDQVRKHRVTSTTLVEQMAAFLVAAPAGDGDAGNSLAHVNIAPMGPLAHRFAERFGCKLWTSYGSTEIGAPIASPARPGLAGVTGMLRPGYEARVVDTHDRELPAGTIGELIVRSDRPWTITPGYFRNPEATAVAWRNGWFHTGDLFRRDTDGNFFFADRLKDAIRRRGENISSAEVEAALLRVAEVGEVAAYAVPSELSEDEVMVCLVWKRELPWTDLAGKLAEAMPHFMVPRYFRALAELPRTANGKVRKDALRQEAVTPDAWDREAAGMILKARAVGRQ